MLVASLDATAGSVIAKPERISPASSGSSHRFFCSSDPYFTRTSALPVSGALQLKTSGAKKLRPVISAILVGQEEIPKPKRLGLGLQLLEDRWNPPLAPIVGTDQLTEIGLLVGHDALTDESLRLCHHICRPLRMLKIHRSR
jgi:hypothetical protein